MALTSLRAVTRFARVSNIASFRASERPRPLIAELGERSREIFRHIVERWARPSEGAAAPSGLSVVVRSFSYRDGYPPDGEGHGGGFVFDCRSLPNPHHVEALRERTGEDAAVADFLERAPEVQEFWANVSDLVDAHVERWLGRGFTSLSVAFGCTGGRHRSVFLAAKLAAHLRGRFPHVGVRVAHGKV